MKKSFAAHILCHKLKSLLCFLLLLSLTNAHGAGRVSSYTRNKLQQELPMLDLTIGNSVLLRTFKKESQLELWMKPENSNQYILFRTYPICSYSGGLGPKQLTGDKMTPEGFYEIIPQNLQPNSRFHLALNIGYPNDYDRYHGRTGNLLMIHGACDSIGCFAMTNSQIEEIYYLVEQAQQMGQYSIPLHAFPFRMTDNNMAQHSDNRWNYFWQQLKIGYDFFNNNNQLPTVTVLNGRYTIH